MTTPAPNPPEADRPSRSPASVPPAPAAEPAGPGRPPRWTSDRAFLATFVVLAVAAILPIWSVRFLPLLDLPNHLAAVHIWHHFDEPWSRAREFYELSLTPAPFGAYHVLTHLVAFALPLEDANRVVLSAYVLGIPAAALAWTCRTGRSPWLSVLTFPLAFSLSWACGFLPFLVGTTLLFVAVVVLDAHLARPTRPRGVAVALLSLACGVSHPLILFAYYVCVAALMLCYVPQWSRLALALPPFAPALALIAWQLTTYQSPMVDLRSGPRFQGAWVSSREMLESLPEYTLDSVSGDLDTRLFWVFFAVAAALFALSLALRLRSPERATAPPGSLAERLRAHRSLVLASAMVACYLLVPLHLARPFDWWFVSGRFAPFICFFVFLAPTAPLRGLSRLLMAPAVAAALALPLHLTGKYEAFDERVEPFARMVERLRPGTDAIFLSLPPRSDEALIIDATNQFSSWIQILHGGFSPDGWWNVGFPFRLKRRLPAPPWNRHDLFDPDVHGVAYDYVIIRNEPPDMPIFTGDHPAWRLVEREGAFSMYERTR